MTDEVRRMINISSTTTNHNEAGSIPDVVPFRRLLRDKLNEAKGDQTELAEIVEDMVTTHATGNCMEHSFVLTHRLLKDGKCKSVEIIFVDHMNDGHVLVLVNRDQDGDITNPKTWGRSFYVCDAQTNLVFTSISQLSSFTRIMRKESKTFVANVLVPYNPVFHRIRTFSMMELIEFMRGFTN